MHTIQTDEMAMLGGKKKNIRQFLIMGARFLPFETSSYRSQLNIMAVDSVGPNR